MNDIGLSLKQDYFLTSSSWADNEKARYHKLVRESERSLGLTINELSFDNETHDNDPLVLVRFDLNV